MALEVKNDLWTPQPFRIYRCLRFSRLVQGMYDLERSENDECADLIARNPHIKFEPGLTDVEVDHLIHEGTNWDADKDNFPRAYLEEYEGRLGNILASIEYTVGVNRDFDAPHFYRPPYYKDDPERNWWIASRTALAKIRIEVVREVIPVED